MAVGVSIGDIYTLIQVVGKIAAAIKSCTTADEDYRTTIAQLDFILHIARTIQNSAHGQDENLQRYVKAFERPIEQFLERTQKYESLTAESDRRSIRRFCRRGAKRMKWVLVAKDDAEKLQASLTPQFTALTMYLQAKSLVQERMIQKDTSRSTEGSEEMEVSTISDPRASQFECMGVAQPILAVRLTLGAISLDVSAESKSMHDALNAFVLLLMDVWNLLHLLFLTSRFLPRAPTMLLDTNIQIEDALGRTMSLPLDQCRSWKNFAGFLDLAFKDCPGELKVKNRNFRLLSRGSSLQLDYSNWYQAVSAGLELTMVMYIQRSGLLDGTCPRCGMSQSYDRCLNWTTCINCSVRYNVHPARPAATTYQSITEDNEENDDDVRYMTEDEMQRILDLEEQDVPSFTYVQWFDSPCSACSDWTSDMFAPDGEEIEVTCNRCCTTHLF